MLNMPSSSAGAAPAAGDSCLSKAFQECPAGMVRNVCVIAHVDHGKTTLADFLVSANGIISARLAGKLRYMDSREDEQARGITMKSSAITLYYEPLLLNLIDSPGHVDFCTEVSSAVNLADIAILLVDAVEGVCSQTESLVRQAIAKKLDILLVLNKLDRLIVELKMSLSEAHRHLCRLIEFVNACLSKAIQGQLLEEDWHTFEKMENHLHFDPAKGNVLFASALHGYAFALEDFGTLWAKRLTARRQWEEKPMAKEGKGPQKSVEQEVSALKAQLVQHLFSRDHYYAKNGEFCAGAEQKGRKTLFEQFVLEPLWELHKCALVDKDIERLRQLANKLALPPLRGKRADETFAELMRNWLPLSSTVVKACARCRSAQKAFQRDDGRLQALFYGPGMAAETALPKAPNVPLPSTASSIRECQPDDQLVLAFAAKSFKAVDQQQQQRRVSLCRVMSGTLRSGDQLFVLLRRPSATSKSELEQYNQENTNSNAHWRPVLVSALFLLLGRELLPVERVPCGRICGIEVNEGVEWIGGPLLCSRPLKPEETPQLDAIDQQKFTEPLVRVIVRPAKPGPTEYDELRAALRQLAILDSAVRLLEPKENELVMLTAGEVHLQKCLEDLNALGQTDLVVSEPIVPFLETLVPDQRLSNAKIMTEHLTECRLRQFSLRIRMRAVPLAGVEQDSQKLMELLQKNTLLIESFREGFLSSQHRAQVDTFRSELTECSCQCLSRLKGSWWAKRPRADIERLFSSGILAFGPPKAKFNLLFNNNALQNGANEDGKAAVSVWEANLHALEQAIVGGFQSAMLHGPLCDEPMQGVGLVLEEWTLEEAGPGIRAGIGPHEFGDEAEEEEENGTKNGQEEEKPSGRSRLDSLNANAQLHGQLISAIRQTCRAALKKHTGTLRLLAAMYECRVQTPEQALGKVQAVLAQKRAKVHSEEVNELSGLFEICALLPVLESFSFCEQLRKRSSGAASAQLEFAGWKLIDEDPFWEPSTEEEMEEFGRHLLQQQQNQQLQNQARQYMDAVRRRKGLPTEDVIVVWAEKQRNLKRNK